MNGPIPLILLIASLYAYIGSFWRSTKDERRRWRTTAFLLAVCFAFSLVWAVWR